MGTIHENKALRNRTHIFSDRIEAGDVMADMLAASPDLGDQPMALSIPMGGVPVAVRIRDRLNCPMDLVIVRKLRIPGNTEAGFGAMTAGKDLFLNESLMARLDLSDADIDREMSRVRGELAERDRTLRGGRPFPNLKGKTVILVDDGLASGYTMKAAVYLANKRQAARTIVAVPTAPRRTIDTLAGSVDALFCANIRDGLSFAVADAYVNWRDLNLADVLAHL